ncbi:hypothetical protein [Burkholderia ubonensis]|uniref:hypothetical protein n=1 Tax=Burkholderia ubonensis TaxID=101571 RepID=UPI0012BAF56E|nr:hypothetical protein [Burkholderia ubonensis]
MVNLTSAQLSAASLIGKTNIEAQAKCASQNTSREYLLKAVPSRIGLTATVMAALTTHHRTHNSQAAALSNGTHRGHA